MDIIGIEIGNTRIKYGLFKNTNLEEVHTAPTRRGSADDVPFGWETLKPELIGMASVVPEANRPIIRTFKKTYGKDVVVLNPADCGIPFGIRNAECVGIDRVLNCKAAKELFGTPVIVVDIGTAITIDIVSSKGIFSGGIIMPGVDLWIGALETTAMIKNIKPARVNFPGKDTNEAIYSGMKYGIEGAINNILDIAFRKYPSATIVLTGGGSTGFKDSIMRRKMVRNHLAMEGIGMLLNEMACRY